MSDIFTEIRKEFYSKSFFEWLLWIIGSLLLILCIKWLAAQYGAGEYEFHVWISATLYLWYVSTISLLVSGTYFVARYAQTHLERRELHPQKPEGVDFSNDLARVKKIKKRAAVIAVVGQVLNALIVYFISRHIPGITPEFQAYAVLGVFFIALIKPAIYALQAVKVEIFGMIEEANYPQKTVADLWDVVDEFKDYEERLEATFERIEKAEENSKEEVSQLLESLTERLNEHKKSLDDLFDKEYQQFKSSDSIRESAYLELRNAQAPLTKEIIKILEEIQNLKTFVIDLRDKNIKGEQLMSALKEFGIESLSQLNVTFQKSVESRNPVLKHSSVLEPEERS